MTLQEACSILQLKPGTYGLMDVKQAHERLVQVHHANADMLDNLTFARNDILKDLSRALIDEQLSRLVGDYPYFAKELGNYWKQFTFGYFTSCFERILGGTWHLESLTITRHSRAVSLRARFFNGSRTEGCFLKGWVHFPESHDGLLIEPINLHTYAFRNHRRVQAVHGTRELHFPAYLRPVNLFPERMLRRRQTRRVRTRDIEVYLVDFLGAKRLSSGGYRIHIGEDLRADIYGEKIHRNVFWTAFLKDGSCRHLSAPMGSIPEDETTQDFLFALSQAGTYPEAHRLLESWYAEARARGVEP